MENKNTENSSAAFHLEQKAIPSPPILLTRSKQWFTAFLQFFNELRIPLP